MAGGHIGAIPVPFQLAPVVVGAFLYARRASSLARRGRPVSVGRQVWFASGLALIAGALATPIDTIAEERLFWVHMVQHLLLGDLAAFCVVKGLTGSLLRPVLALPAVARLRGLAHPLAALPLWAVNLYVWHVPPIYQAALQHSGLHTLEHGLFFATGALMWAAVIEPLPGVPWFGPGWKAAYVLAVRTLGAGLANVFIWSGHSLYDWYGTPLSDQVIGGAIMFTEGSMVTLFAFAWLFLGWMAGGEARPARRGPPPRRAPARARSPRSAGARGRPA